MAESYDLKYYIQDMNNIEGMFEEPYCNIIPMIHNYCQQHWPGPYKIILKDNLAYIQIDNSPDGFIWTLQNHLDNFLNNI